VTKEFDHAETALRAWVKLADADGVNFRRKRDCLTQLSSPLPRASARIRRPTLAALRHPH